MTLYRITGLVLIVLPIAFNGLFFALGRAFSYPDILRHPTADILSRFQAGGGRLIGLWYGFAMTALLAIPMALLVQQVFPEQAALAAISGIIGALSGLVQAMGLLRWPLLVPGLAARYTAADATAGEREAVSVVFNAFHQYVGVVVGEHLGYVFTGGWTILVSAMMLGSTLFSPLLGGLGVVAAVGILAGLLEPAGWKATGAINAISYLVWSVWLIVSGLTLILA